MKMMNTLKKYKKPLISSGILLSVLVSSALINLDFTNDDIADAPKETKAVSIIEENSKISLEEDLESKDNENRDKKEDDIENSSDSVAKKQESIKNEDPEKSNKDKKEEEVKSTQSKKSNKDSNKISGEKYTVKKGDTLSLIADRANVSITYLKQLNNLSSDIIYENQVLKLKGSISNTSAEVANRGSQRNEDLYWLSRIIHAEAQGEPYEGKVAVGNVIINRVNNPKFPNTVKGVVFDKQDGYTQFSPVIDGTIYNTPDAESIKAATDVLNGARPVGNALYFLNPRKSTNFWIIENRQYLKTIGLHDFYY